jgi:hypothetical protein
VRRREESFYDGVPGIGVVVLYMDCLSGRESVGVDFKTEFCGEGGEVFWWR